MATPLAATTVAQIFAGQVALKANVLGIGNSTLWLEAGNAPSGSYGIRVASGVTASAKTVLIGGWHAGDNPSVILQGTLSGDSMLFGLGGLVSDVFSGPNGGLVATGATPAVTFNFTGRLKSAPYTNDSNFRYNDLPISSASPLTLTLNPSAYATNGTSVTNAANISAVNILVNNSVTLVNPLAKPASVPGPNGTVATGAVSWPGTNLVLQSSGDISTSGLGSNPAFYWPGMVYLGTVAANGDGSAAPGTLGAQGKIHIAGNFNNVLPGNLNSGGGIHFISGQPLDITGGSTITTNGNSWINFGTAALTAQYASSKGTFYAGAPAANNMVNYGVLRTDYFHYQAPDSKR